MILCSEGYPRESDATESIREHVAEYRRVAVSRWKVSMKSWMLPVSHPRNNLRFDVSHDGFPWFRIVGCMVWQKFAQITRFDIWSHPFVWQRGDKLADVVDHLLTAYPKLFSVHDGRVWNYSEDNRVHVLTAWTTNVE